LRDRFPIALPLICHGRGLLSGNGRGNQLRFMKRSSSAAVSGRRESTSRSIAVLRVAGGSLMDISSGSEGTCRATSVRGCGPDVADSRLECVSVHVDRFTADERTPSARRSARRRAHAPRRGRRLPAHLATFLAELSRLGRPVAAIVLTHWHRDHSFDSAALDVPIVAHADTATELAR
jgi:hypothetical protein